MCSQSTACTASLDGSNFISAGSNASLSTAVISPVINLTPPPGTFNGTNTVQSSGCTLFTQAASSQLICSGTSHLLVDGDFGPSQGYNIFKVFSWSQDFDIIVTLPAPAIITRVSLFFYYSPSIGVGLPNIDGLYWDTASPYQQTNALSFTLAGNQDLSQDDAKLRNISMVITSNATVLPYTFLRLHFSFPSSLQIRTLLLSELQLFNAAVSLPPVNSITFLPRPSMITFGTVNPQSSYNLSCTVVNQGSFEWNWTLPATIRYQMWTSDGTRTTILQLSNITSDYSANYACSVRYKAQTSLSTFNVALEFPTTLMVTPNKAYASLFDYVTFSCEAYGYSSPASSFSWDVPGSSVPVTANTLTYQLGVQYGNNSLQSGSSMTGRSSISSLYFRVPTDKDYETYTCLYGQYSATAQLLPPPAVVTTPTNPSFTTSAIITATSAISGNSLSAVIGGVVGSIILLLIVITGLIVGVVWLKHWNAIHAPSLHKDDTSCDPVYSDISKPEPPPYPAHFLQSTYATVDDKIFQSHTHQGMRQNNHWEHKVLGGSPAPPPSSGSPAPPPSTGSPAPPPSTCGGTLKKLAVGIGHLRSNPMYVSADNIIEATGTGGGAQLPDATDDGFCLDIYTKPLPPAARMQGSTSTLSSTPPLPQPYNPIYGEALAPHMFTECSQFEGQDQCDDQDQSSPMTSIYANPEPLLKAESPLVIGPQHIREVRPLGVGQFGQVILAETINLSLKDLKMSATNNDKGVCVLVAMKRLKEEADSTTKEAFEKEIKFMSRLNHDNVVRVLGVCLSRSAFILMEYMENGDLHQYLQMYELAPPGSCGSQHSLSPAVLVYVALQVASGMRYLSSRNFVHRDLATRNCLVGAKNVVKIADFGMSRSLYSSDYYKLRGRAMLPIRWMARECFYGIFSQKTDVWAYGVTVWEIFTFSKRQPYDEMSDQQVIENAITDSGQVVLARPSSCPEEVYHVMLRCWDHDPDTRATFDEVFHSLTSIHARE